MSQDAISEMLTNEADFDLRSAKRRLNQLKIEIDNLSSERFMKAPVEISTLTGLPKNKITTQMITQFVRADKRIQSLIKEHHELTFTIAEFEEDQNEKIDHITISISSGDEHSKVSVKEWIDLIDENIEAVGENIRHLFDSINVKAGILEKEFWRDDIWENAVVYSYEVGALQHVLKSTLGQVFNDSLASKLIKVRLETLKGQKEDCKNLIELAKGKCWNT